MKKNFTILTVLFAVILVISSCEKEHDRPPLKSVDPSMILEIKDLYKIQADSGDNYTFVDDYMLYATVVMDDSTGNIYKEAYLQDSTGGINLYKMSYSRALRVGQYIRLNLNGASIKNYSGKMEVIYSNVLDFGKSFVVQQDYEPILPFEVTMEDIFTATYDCELVTLTDVQFADSDTAMTYAVLGGTSSQNRNIVDCNGNAMIIRNSDYSLFAGDSLPNGKGNMTGIITKYIYSGGDTAWQLLIRNPDEVLLNNPRCGSEK